MACEHCEPEMATEGERAELHRRANDAYHRGFITAHIYGEVLDDLSQEPFLKRHYRLMSSRLENRINFIRRRRMGLKPLWQENMERKR